MRNASIKTVIIIIIIIIRERQRDQGFTLHSTTVDTKKKEVITEARPQTLVFIYHMSCELC